MVLNSLSFCLSAKFLISLSNLDEGSAGWSNLGCRFSPFITLNIFCHLLLACRVSAKILVDNLMGILLYVICWSSLAVFNIFSLYLFFDSLINMCLSMFPFGFTLYGPLCTSWTWLIILFLMLGKLSTIVSWTIFSDAFTLSSGNSIIWMLVHVMLFQKSLRLTSIFFSFLKNSALWQLFSPFYVSIILFSSFILPPLFCYWFLLVYFQFQLLCSSSLIVV